MKYTEGHSGRVASVIAEVVLQAAMKIVDVARSLRIAGIALSVRDADQR